MTLLKQIFISRTFFFFLLSFILSRCANQLPPTGGEVDKILPEIVSTYPEPNTINFKDDYFEIEFSEYVDKRSVKDAIFISPVVDEALDYSWSGTSVRVTFPVELKQDITYTITIGTDVVDLNNKNRMASSFTFAFSTGGKIDTKTITGKVFDKVNDGIFIFAYKINNSIDSLLKHKPDYVTQSGLDGSFKLQGLASAIYRVFAVNDEYKDLLYDFDNDQIGMPYKDISLLDPDTIFTNLDFKITKTDTIAPRFIKALMTDQNHILITFSEGLDSTSYRSTNFELIDSTAEISYLIPYALKGNTKPEEYILIIDNKIPIADEVYLKANELKDQSGNTKETDFIPLTLSEKQDTTAVSIFKTLPEKNGVLDYFKPQIKIFFNDYFAKQDLERGIVFTDTNGIVINVNLKYGDYATLVILPASKLKTEKDYQLKLNLNFFKDLAGNKLDSILTINFKAGSNLDLTGVSGKIININTDKNPVLVLENKTAEKILQKNIDSENFSFKNVIPGVYNLWFYYDENKNEKYDYGWPQPLKFSEQFFVYPDSLNLRPRWELTDIVFKIE